VFGIPIHYHLPFWWDSAAEAIAGAHVEDLDLEVGEPGTV
jgi:hypothetical protein